MKRIYNNFLFLQSVMFSFLLCGAICIMDTYATEKSDNKSDDEIIALKEINQELQKVINRIEKCYGKELKDKIDRIANRSEDIRGILCCLSPELPICSDTSCDRSLRVQSCRDLLKRIDCVEDLLNFLLYVLCGIFGESNCASSFCDDVRYRLKDEQNLDGERGKAPISPAPMTQQQLDDMKLSLLNYLQNQLGAQSSLDNLLPQ